MRRNSERGKEMSGIGIEFVAKVSGVNPIREKKKKKKNEIRRQCLILRILYEV